MAHPCFHKTKPIKRDEISRYDFLRYYLPRGFLLGDWTELWHTIIGQILGHVAIFE
jgi:hypothetical protein